MANTDTMDPEVAEHATSDHTERLNALRIAPEAYQVMFGFENYIRKSGLESKLMHLVKLRASYINGCAYCVDMHTKDARHEGETEQRLYAVPVWRETPFFTDRERAAFAWTEAVTEIWKDGVSDEIYQLARSEFSEKELVDLTMVVVAINSWNRLAIPFRVPVGNYVAGSSQKSR